MRALSRRNHRCAVPRNHVVVHAIGEPIAVNDEERTHEHQLRFASAFRFRWNTERTHWHGTWRTTDRFTFWDWMDNYTNPRRPLWVWSHNSSYVLTLLGLWREIDAKRYTLEQEARQDDTGTNRAEGKKKWKGCCITEDPPTVIAVRTQGGHTIRFVDWRNYLDVSIGTLSSMMFGDECTSVAGSDHEAQSRLACGSSVDILTNAVVRLLALVRDANLGNLAVTAGSQSLHWFRHIGGDKKLTWDNDPQVRRDERACYFGARREVYFSGTVIDHRCEGMGPLMGAPADMPTEYKGPVYRLDVSGAYPTIMRDNVFPMSYLHQLHCPKPWQVLDTLKVYCACAWVTLDSGLDPWPVRERGETHWRIGRVETCLCGPELSRAINSGYVKEVKLMRLYTMGRPFREWAAQAIHARETLESAGEKLEVKLIKQFSNSLHGKLGQRNLGWMVIPDIAPLKDWGQWSVWDAERHRAVWYRAIGGACQVKGLADEPLECFPLCAAYVTAYHREMMRVARERAGLREVFYEDADSLHVSERGFNDLVAHGYKMDGSPGNFRVEQIAKRATYYGPGVYELDDFRQYAGVSPSATALGGGDYEQPSFRSLDSALATGAPTHPFSRQTIARVPRPKVRGLVGSDGWVSPER